MKIACKVLVCALMAVTAAWRCAADDFGISRKTFDTDGSHTVFTFRHGELIYEITVFLDLGSKQRRNWVERFYADGQPVFVRSGAAHLVSERYTGLSHVSVVQGKREGTTYPQRLSVGQESYDLDADGFYRLVVDPQSVLRESILVDGEFSGPPMLDAERKKHLHQSQTQE